MNLRDIELISTYLDGELKESDSARLEARLKTDPELVSVLNDLRATRILLRKLPSRKAPRNFTLTRKMVGQNPPLPRVYPIFRLATVVATLLFFFSFGINSFGSQLATQSTGFGMGGGGEPLAAQAPAMEEPLASTPAEPAAPETYSNLSPTLEPQVGLAPAQSADAMPTDNAARIEATPLSKGVETENALGGEQVQGKKEALRVVPVAWQFGLAVLAVLSALLMGLIRQLSARRWR
jgi:anti-sigma factor RsiW